MTKKQKNKEIIQGKDIEFNRKALENKKTKMLILNHENKKDRLYERDSGLNHILCQIAKNHKTILAFNLNEIRKQKDKKQKAKILSRMIQNIKLIKKFDNKFRLLNYKSKQQAFSFLNSLGLPTKKARDAVKK